jgi:NAD+ diphosphatase
VEPPGRFVASSRQQAPDGRPAFWFLVRDFHPLVHRDGNTCEIPILDPSHPLIPTVAEKHFLGTLDGTPCFAVEVAIATEPPELMEFINLRALHAGVDEQVWALAGRAVQIVDWARNHRYCGRCGSPNLMSAAERSLRCPSCGLAHYPRLSPAVIVLVHDGERVLLGRSTRSTTGFYSVLAGFVEPGESLEETVEREIFEETGIRVQDVRYFGSQPWPFPNSLMIGFTASYAGGEIELLDDEILDAGWFTVDDLPAIPGRISIARQLIDWWIDRQRAAR